MSPETIRQALARLEPSIPWSHHFDLGHGIETVSPEEEKFYNKAIGLGKLGELLTEVLPLHCRSGELKDLSVLDLASAEGVHSIRLAQAGAQVVGVEGRQIYVDRATFAAKALGVENVSFRQGDVRTVGPSEIGTFECVIFSGILHHLGQSSFEGMLQTLASLSTDTVFLYTHVSTPASIKSFRLEGPVKTESGYEGYLYREHKDGAASQEKYRKVRASLDNTFSFWATEESLVNGLVKAGFRCVSKLLKPHLFSSPEKAAFRLLLIARK
ncbi:MAG: class I SAM-dependent methyltransferase [Phormidesmis sp.]